jgi:hypothetical protein
LPLSLLGWLNQPSGDSVSELSLIRRPSQKLIVADAAARERVR